MNDMRELNPSRRMTLRRQLGLRIVRARQRRGWNQEALARRMGVSRSVLGRWERGICAPSLEALVKLAEVLEVAVDELLRGTPALVAQLPPGQRREAAWFLNGFLQTIGWPALTKGKTKEEEWNGLRRQ